MILKENSILSDQSPKTIDIKHKFKHGIKINDSNKFSNNINYKNSKRSKSCNDLINNILNLSNSNKRQSRNQRDKFELSKDFNSSDDIQSSFEDMVKSKC